jgi:hypothetical protein
LSEEDEYLHHIPIVRSTSTIAEEMSNEATLSEALVIRPSMILIGQPSHPPIAMSVDQLDGSERETYLRDFFPPNPAMVKLIPSYKRSERHRQHPFLATKETKNNNEWRVARV